MTLNCTDRCLNFYTCGNLTGHGSGKCDKCRERKCISCNVLYTPRGRTAMRGIQSKKCSDCARLYNARAKNDPLSNLGVE